MHNGTVSGEYPGETWSELPSPGAAGWDVEKLAEARGIARGADSTALMVVHRGRVVLSWGAIDRKFIVASVRKSLLSALYGIHVAEGRIDLSSTLEQLGIDDNEPALTDSEKQATIVDLLKSRSGVYHPANATTEYERAQLPPRGSHRPGAYWCYNNWDFNVLGTIFEQLVGRSLFLELADRIGNEIGMQDLTADDGWYFGKHYSKHLAYHVGMSARDLARFGVLFLNGGCWKGKQIVPALWVADSTRAHSATPLGMGYGYMWWSGLNKTFRTEAEEQSFSARGYRGQILHVFPALDLVFVHRYLGRDDADQGVSHVKINQMLDLVLAARPEDHASSNGLVAPESATVVSG
jgi:CubicO group peptidase (beta-lactamase class C family)